MGARIRIYHPDTPPTWLDRALDLYTGHVLPAREQGVDYGLVHRATTRALEALLDGVEGLHVISADVVRVDSRFRLPEPDAARIDLCGEMVRRLRFEQVQVGGRRTALPIRWVEFGDGPQGTVVLLRLATRTDPGLRSLLAVKLGDEERDGEQAVAGE